MDNLRKILTRRTAVGAAMLALIGVPTVVIATPKSVPGVSDKQIKIGNIMPYSGPASAYSVIGKAEAAYFRKVNDEGGINGRKIEFISRDDAYSPPKAVEQARRLVESDGVLLIFNPLGTPSNSAIQRYMNHRKVPQLFVASGATKWDDPKSYPWTMGWQPSYQAEGRIYAKYLLKNRPNARVAVLYQNDDYGKDYLKGLMDGLGANAKMVVAHESYDVSEPTIDSHIVNLKASDADVLIDFATPKFAAQSIKKVHELGWKPTFILNNVSASVGGVLAPAGLDAAQDIISAAYLKDATDPSWKDDSGMNAWRRFMERYLPEADPSDSSNVFGYAAARTLAQVLRQCGNDLSRANVMKQAAMLRNYDPDMLLPGIKINTSASDFAPIQQLQLMQFKGKAWQRFGPVISGDTES